MINTFFKTIVSRPSQQSILSTTRLPQQKSYAHAKFKKYKLILLLLTKATAKTLRLSFQIIHQSSKTVPLALSKLSQLCGKNIDLSIYLAFNRIKFVASQQKSKDKILKNVINLLQRIQKYKLKQSFSKLILENSRVDHNFIENYYAERVPTFGRKLMLLVKRQKKNVFDRINSWAKFVKSYSKLRVICVIRGRLQKQAKQLFFTRINRFLLKKYGKGGAEKEMGDLRTQLQDLTVQLGNKDENIQRLESQINQMRVDQSNLSFNHNLSYGEYYTNGSKVHKTYSQKKLSFNDRSARGSVAGSNEELSLNDVSLGSILGNLNKSRNGSVSRLDSACDCSCGYKARYQKYKSLNQSLKNQLQIVKEELEVAKDLNEHFTDQIKNYLNGDKNEGDYDKLKRQNQVLTDERDQLRDKVFKYQKHINNLKAEFKVKMEELYRKVRKDM